MLEQHSLRRRGLELFEQLHGGHAGAAMVAEVQEICPAFADMELPPFDGQG